MRLVVDGTQQWQLVVVMMGNQMKRRKYALFFNVDTDVENVGEEEESKSYTKLYRNNLKYMCATK